MNRLSERLNALSPYVLSLFRIVAGLVFLSHGTQKLFGFPPTPNMPAMFTLSWTSGLIELICGALIALGLLTRAAAFVASGEMAFAYFLAHAPKHFFPSLNGGDAAILYCFFFFYLTFAGAGPVSVDAILSKKSRITP